MRRVSALAAVLAVALFGPTALGAREGTWATGASASVELSGTERTRGAFWDAQLEYGLSETFHAGLELGLAHALVDLEMQSLRLTPLVGARLDVVEWIPYAACGPSLLVGVGPERPVHLGAELALGVDYLWSRNWALGAQYHLAAIAVEESELVHRAGLRIMYHWGW
jgi:hypothetical protein